MILIYWAIFYASNSPATLVELLPPSGNSQPSSPQLGASLTEHPLRDITNFEVLSPDNQLMYILLRTEEGYKFPTIILPTELRALIEQARSGSSDAVLCSTQAIINTAKLYFNQYGQHPNSIMVNGYSEQLFVHPSVFEAIRAANLL